MAYTPEAQMSRETGNATVGIKVLLAALLAGCVVLGGLNGFNSFFDTTSPYPVKSYGLNFGLRFGPDPIYWLDNDRAMFPAYAIERSIGPDGMEDSAPPGIYIWDTKNNTSAMPICRTGRGFFALTKDSSLTQMTAINGANRKLLRQANSAKRNCCRTIDRGSSIRNLHNAACLKRKFGESIRERQLNACGQKIVTSKKIVTSI